MSFGSIYFKSAVFGAVSAVLLFVGVVVGEDFANGKKPVTHPGTVQCGSHIFLAIDLLFFENGKGILGVRLSDGTNVLVPADKCDISLDGIPRSSPQQSPQFRQAPLEKGDLN